MNHASTTQTITRVCARLGLLALMMTLALSLTTPAGYAATFKATTLADSGPGSLREVITQANGSTGEDSITFRVK